MYAATLRREISCVVVSCYAECTFLRMPALCRFVGSGIRHDLIDRDTGEFPQISVIGPVLSFSSCASTGSPPSVTAQMFWGKAPRTCRLTRPRRAPSFKSRSAVARSRIPIQRTSTCLDALGPELSVRNRRASPCAPDFPCSLLSWLASQASQCPSRERLFVSD